MGVRKGNGFPIRHNQTSNSYEQDKIVSWLASGSRLGQHNYQHVNDDHLGAFERLQLPDSTFRKHASDTDQQSNVSADDIISVSDSSQESLTSDSSSQTSSTSATDCTEFLDDVEREQSQAKNPCPGSVDSLEAQIPLHSITLDAGHDARPRHCNPRRSACSTKYQAQPCKLKRDTDCTDQFVSLLIVFATRLITAIWPLSASPPMMSSCFNGAGVLPLQVFIQETLKRSRTSFSTLQVALYYLVLLKTHLPLKDCGKDETGGSNERKQCRAMQCGRRMFLSALMLASKYLQDRNYSARAWSKISGLRSHEINENEREYLSLIDYSLHVPKSSFDNWNKIVIALSKLSKEDPQCSPDSFMLDLHHGRPGSGAYSNTSGPMDLGEDLFTHQWWSNVVQKLTPEIVKDAALAEEFLSTHVPLYKTSLSAAAMKSGNSEDGPKGLDLLSTFTDVNLSDGLKNRSEMSRSSTPQTPNPIQMSPARTAVMPMQPRLQNLPTPQTTPRLAETCQDRGATSRVLRCQASADTLRNMRRQCIMNANLDRCPPPRPQASDLPFVKSSLRPAETIQEFSSRSTTPCASSPLSATSESTSYKSRSRSSSISSISSCSSYASSMPRYRVVEHNQYSSPLAHVRSSSNSSSFQSKLQAVSMSGVRFVDEGYGSGEEPLKRASRQLASCSEVVALEGLMSLSTPMESSSQSATPTLDNYRHRVQESQFEPQRGHKRSLSKTESHLQSNVRGLLWKKPSSINVLEDALRVSNSTSLAWQFGHQEWAEPKRALPNAMDSKRVAYCGLQQYASAPNLGAQYLNDVRVSAAS